MVALTIKSYPGISISFGRISCPDQRQRNYFVYVKVKKKGLKSISRMQNAHKL